jgi:sn-glycerol 3-phosphate transport system substrate-binding protein
MRIKLLAASFAVAGAFAVPAQAQTEVQWWHSMTGVNNERVSDAAKG